MHAKLLEALQLATLDELGIYPFLVEVRLRLFRAKEADQAELARPVYRLCLTRRGTVQFESKQKKLALKPGTVLLIKPEQAFRCRCVEESELIIVYFSLSQRYPPRAMTAKELTACALRDWPLALAMEQLPDWSVIADDAAMRLAQDVEHLLREQGALSEARDLLMQLRFMTLMIEWLRASATQKFWDRSRKSGSNRELVRFAQDYIHKHYARSSLNVTHLAEIVFLSNSHFQRIFREETGMNPLDYLIQTRIAQACNLMALHERLKIQEICGQVGFSNVQRFHAMFRKHLGMTPKAYREHLKQRNAQVSEEEEFLF